MKGSCVSGGTILVVRRRPRLAVKSRGLDPNRDSVLHRGNSLVALGQGTLSPVGCRQKGVSWI